MPIDNSGLPDARIDEHPPGEPVLGDFLVFFDRRNGVTKKTLVDKFIPLASKQGQNFEWIANRVDDQGQPFPYEDLDLVTYNGDIFQSLVDNNTSVPGVGDLWLKITRSYSGGFWKAGAYTDDRPWVFSDHTGSTELYELKDPARPFISIDITTEEAAGKWVAMFGKVKLEVVDVTQGEILFDIKKRNSTWYKGNANINGPRTWRIINFENTLEVKFLFTMQSPSPQTMPANFKMSDPLYNFTTRQWTPRDVGDYHAIANYDGVQYWYLRIFGPFTGGGNAMPTTFDNTILRTANILDGPRSYFDPEGDLENNPPPEVQNPLISGVNKPGNLLTATFNFYSYMGYAPGAHRYKWYRQEEDGSNREEIIGSIGSTYNVQDEDVDKAIVCGIVAVQVAAPPANGNPESAETFTNAILIETNVVVIPELDLAVDGFNHWFKKGTWDTINNRWPDNGNGKSGVYATQGTLPQLPTYSAVDQSLTFNPDDGQDGLEFANDTNGSSRTWELTGVVELSTVSGLIKHVISMLSNMSFRVFVPAAFHVSSSASGVFTFVPVAGVKYRFRLRANHNGTQMVFRLQLNYDIDTATYLFDETVLVSSTGASLGAGTTRIGSNKSATPAQGWEGKMWELALRLGTHTDVSKEVNLWKRLNNVAGV